MTPYSPGTRDRLAGHEPHSIAIIATMGAKNPERDRRWAGDMDRLGDYARNYVLFANCGRSGCERRGIPIDIQRWIQDYGSTPRLGALRKRLKCSCGWRGGSFSCRFNGWARER